MSSTPRVRRALLALTSAVHVLGVVVVIFLALTEERFTKFAHTNNYRLATPVVRSDPDATLVQRLHVPVDGWSRIDVQARAVGAGTGRLRARIRDSLDGPDIREAFADARDFGDGALRPLLFEPISDSGDRTYLILLDGATVDPFGVPCECLYRSSFLGAMPSAKDGAVPRRDDADPTDLVLGAYSSTIEGRALSTRLRTLADRFDAYKPAWLGGRTALISACIMLACGAVLSFVTLDRVIAGRSIRSAIGLCAVSVIAMTVVPILYLFGTDGIARVLR